MALTYRRKKKDSLLPRGRDPLWLSPSGAYGLTYAEERDMKRAALQANKARLRLKNPPPSMEMADIEHEFSMLADQRNRFEFLKRAQEAAIGSSGGRHPPGTYTGPPPIDFSEVVKQGMRGSGRGRYYTPEQPHYTRLDPNVLGNYIAASDKISVDPGKHISSAGAVIQGKGAFRGPIPRTPITEIESHELAHRVARDVIRDPIFIKLHAESDGLLPFLYSEGESQKIKNEWDPTFFQGTRKWVPATAEREGHYEVDDTYSREHQMIRAATEGSDPNKPPELRNLAKRAHTPQSIRDAKDFNELVKRYWKEKRKQQFLDDQYRKLLVEGGAEGPSGLEYKGIAPPPLTNFPNPKPRLTRAERALAYKRWMERQRLNDRQAR